MKSKWKAALLSVLLVGAMVPATACDDYFLSFSGLGPGYYGYGPYYFDGFYFGYDDDDDDFEDFLDDLEDDWDDWFDD